MDNLIGENTLYTLPGLELDFVGGLDEFNLRGVDFVYVPTSGKFIHSKTFGSRADKMYGTDTSVRFAILEDGTLEFSASAYGGMTWLLFDPDNIGKGSELDRETMEYGVKVLRKLQAERI